MNKCKYKPGGKKYILTETYEDTIPFGYTKNIMTNYASYRLDGKILIGKGYSWDGASGPTIDTPDTMDGSLVHDVLYQFIREGHLSMKYRKEADKCIKRMCEMDGMPKWRSWYWYLALRAFGRSAAIGRRH